jgi:hypothetical protein
VALNVVVALPKIQDCWVCRLALSRTWIRKVVQICEDLDGSRSGHYLWVKFVHFSYGLKDFGVSRKGGLETLLDDGELPRLVEPNGSRQDWTTLA